MEKLAIILIIVYGIVASVIVGGVVYILWHFISKFW